MEQLYTDFTTKLLPKIQEGLVITKEYFTDLFSRYIKYLIVTDSLLIILGIVLVILGYISYKKYITYTKSEEYNEYDGINILYFILIIGLSIAGTCIFIGNVGNLVKDIYIPEVRIIEKLQSFKNTNN